MIIHSLEVQALGPFATRQRVDFDALNASGLFLLDGPTGSGKSTLLAAMTFALYGVAPGDRKVPSLHSTLAEPGRRPEVTLEITLSNRRLRILRWPAHKRPAKRVRAGSDGLTTEQAGVLVEELVEGEWVSRANRNDEAGQFIGQLIGLSSDQFMRVVFLPQGEFSNFLKAKSDDRVELLRKLFGTQRFDQVEEQLKKKHAEQKKAFEEDQKTLETLTAEIISAIGSVIPDEDESGWWNAPGTDTDQLLASPDDAELSVLIDRATQVSDEVVAVSQQAMTTATEQEASHRTALESLRTTRAQLQAAQQFQTRRETHQQAREPYQHAERAVARHRAAVPIHDAAHEVTVKTQALTDAVVQWEEHYAPVIDHEIITAQWMPQAQLDALDVPSVAELSPSVARQHLEDWNTLVGVASNAEDRLRDRETDEETIATLSARLQTLTSQEKTLTQQITSAQETQAELTETLRAIEEALADTEGATTRQEHAEQAVAQATQKLNSAQSAEKAKAKLEDAKKAHTAATDKAQQARETYQDLIQRRLDAAASLLAAELTAGEACAVCGSLEHPAPAAAQDDLSEISAERIQQAQQRFQAADEARTTAATVFADADKQYTQLTADASGLSVDETTAALAEAREALTAAREQVTRREKLQSEKEANDKAQQRTAEKISQAKEKLTETQTQHAATAEQLTERKNTLAQALGEMSSVAELRAAVEPAGTLVRQIRQAVSKTMTAVTEHETATQRLDQVLARSSEAAGDSDDVQGFTTVAEADEALLQPEVLRDYEQRVERWKSENAALKEIAAQENVQKGLQLLNDEVPEPTEEQLSQAQLTLTAAQEETRKRSQELGAHTKVRDTVHRQTADLQAILDRHEGQMAAFEELEALLKVVRGQGENDLKMPLASYVLAGWLERVADAATLRLEKMTQGRYSLEHSVETVGNIKGGLELLVRDHVNDTNRRPETLSGGETFMASLALALGLADTVQAEAGGISMDTLFIDEGFGSLDGETLEQVMDVLNGLHDDGRTICLVSHVESMKNQIPYRAKVYRTGQGSSAVQVMGPEGVLSS